MDAGIGVYPALSATTRLTFPSPAAVAAAKLFAASRQGRIAFAVADPRGGIRGLDVSRPYPSASLVKAMLLVAYLDRLERLGEKLRPAAHARLDAMIRSSDNHSANAVFRKVGPAELRELAARAGMKSFAVGATWGAARVTAADQARFFLSLDRLLPAGQAPFVRDLMTRIAPEHSWGIPAAARPRWQVFFKGGWRPEPGGELVHQGALLQDGSRSFSLVVLTVGNPSHSYGTKTVRGLASILLTAGRGSPSDDRSSVPAPSAGELVPVRQLPPGEGASPPELFPIGAGSARVSGK
jgi:hypothetical protein